MGMVNLPVSFYSSTGERLKAAEVANRLVRTSRLPAHGEIRVTACWGASTTEIHDPKSLSNHRSSPNMHELYAFLSARFGHFTDTLVGALEQHLIRL